jgi:hypothetical protein
MTATGIMAIGMPGSGTRGTGKISKEAKKVNIFSKFSKVAAALFALAFVVGTAHAQRSYPLTCRGGGTLTIANDGSDGVRISFQPGPGAAPQGLSPGQGSWSDRAFRPGEPTTICDSAASAARYVGRLVQSGQYVILQVHNDGNGCLRVTRVGP